MHEEKFLFLKLNPASLKIPSPTENNFAKMNAKIYYYLTVSIANKQNKCASAAPKKTLPYIDLYGRQLDNVE